MFIYVMFGVFNYYNFYVWKGNFWCKGYIIFMILNGVLVYLIKYVCYLIFDFFMCVCLNNLILNWLYCYLIGYNCRWFILFCIFDIVICMFLWYKFYCIL